MLRLVLIASLVAGCPRTDEVDDLNGVDPDPLPPTFIGYTERSSDAERRGTSLQVALVKVDVQEDGSWTIGDQIGISPLTGTGNFGIILPDEAPNEHIGSLEGGRSGAAYLPVVFDDVNRDGNFTDGGNDLVLGYANDHWLVWLDAPGSGEREGWSVFDRSREQPAFLPLTAQAVVELWGLDGQPRLIGQLTRTGERIGVVARDARFYDEGEPSDFRAWSAVANADTGRFDVRVTVRPPVGAFQFAPDSVRFTRMVHNIFIDNDENGSYTPEIDDLFDVGLCWNGVRLDLRFIDTPRTIEVARILQRERMTSGWRFVAGDEEINTPATNALPFGEGCAL